MIFLIVIGGAVIALGALAFLLSRGSRKSAAASSLDESASDTSVSFDRVGSPELVAELARFALFSHGADGQIANLIASEHRQVRVKAFHYSRAGSDDAASRENYLVALFEHDRLDVPAFALRPSAVRDKIGDALGFLDIDLGVHSWFSGKYRLIGESAPSVRGLFTDKLLSVLKLKRNLNIEGRGTRLLVYRLASKRGQTLRAFQDEARQLFQLFQGDEATSEQPDETEPTTSAGWTCAFCDAKNPANAAECTHCGAGKSDAG